MADDDINKAVNFMNNINRLNTTAEQVPNLDDLLEDLLQSSISAPSAEDIDSIEDISGEYSDLNNTIDELNSYLDVWEERHNRLRAKIHEALREGKSEELSTDQAKVLTCDREGEAMKSGVAESTDKGCEDEDSVSTENKSNT